MPALPRNTAAEGSSVSHGRVSDAVSRQARRRRSRSARRRRARFPPTSRPCEGTSPVAAESGRCTTSSSASVSSIRRRRWSSFAVRASTSAARSSRCARSRSLIRCRSASNSPHNWRTSARNDRSSLANLRDELTQVVDVTPRHHQLIAVVALIGERGWLWQTPLPSAVGPCPVRVRSPLAWPPTLAGNRPLTWHHTDHVNPLPRVGGSDFTRSV